MLQSIQRNVTWRAIPFAGLAAGTAHLLVNLVLTPLMLDLQPDLILRYMGSLALGQGVLMETDNTVVPVVVGLIVHFTLSILYTLLIAIVIHRWGLIVGILGGALLGLCIYLINYYTMTTFVNWMFAIDSPVMIIAHLIFGAVAGGVYETYDHFDLPIQENLKNV